MYFIKTPELLKKLYPQQIWSLPQDDKSIYLTFDDGPTPGVTDWVLRVLEEYDAEATFFLVGNNVQHHPNIVRRIIGKGHSIGNHTQNHLNGWSTQTRDYLKNTLQCSQILETTLFRPPYGRITRRQAAVMRKRYKIIMWDVLSGDFDRSISKEKVLRNVLTNTVAGSIIVFHDSLKAETRMKYALPRVLEHFSKKGYQFKKISS